MKEKLHFKTNVLIKSIIGKDLITDENIAILELVKNSFDAMSKRVNIELHNLLVNNDLKIKKPTNTTSKIIIQDFGKGMTLNDLKNKWLNIAYSEKKDLKEENGRILAGNKGIGRFSCDRLGEYLDIYTRAKSQNVIHLKIDWKQFEVDTRDLEIQEIELDYDIIAPEKFEIKTGYKLFRSGTILEIRKLRANWGRDKILDLKNNLQKLINPNQAFKKDSFIIQIFAKEFLKDDKSYPEYQRVNGIIQNKIFEKLNFKTTSIEAQITTNGQKIVTRLNDKGRNIFTLEEVNESFGLIRDCKITLYYLSTLSKIFFTKQTGIRAVDFGSIFLFVNGFRIPPYGDIGDDWLGIEVRKGQGQRRYLGTREVIGRIELSDEKGIFQIISNRAGLVHNRAFVQLTKSTDPYGFFYKTFRRLERFVVEGLGWDSTQEKDKELEKKILHNDKWKETDNLYKESQSEKDRRILSRIIKIIDSKKDEVINLEIDKDFITELINSEREKAEIELDGIADEIASGKYTTDEIQTLFNKLSDRNSQLKDLKETIQKGKIDMQGKTLQSSFKSLENTEKKIEQSVKEIADLKNRLTEFEERERKLKEKLEVEKEKNTYLKSTSKVLSDDAKGLIHNIKLTAKEINSNSERLIELFHEKNYKGSEILRRLSVVKFNAEKALKISMLITRANFRTQANNQIIDIPKYIEQYLTLYSEIFEKNQLSFEILNKNTSLVKKVSVLDLSLVFDDLISNSTKAGAKQVLVEITKTRSHKLRMIYADNGRGLPKKFLDDPEQIFELGVTTTEEGSGIGMHSIRKALKGMNATITFIGNGQKLKGANFELIFN